MNVYHQKASAFVHHLLSNPALKNLTPLQKEDQIYQFLSNNLNQLGPTLTSQQFFPDLTIQQVLDILTSCLMDLTNERLLPAIKSIVQRINFSFLQFIKDSPVRPSVIQEQVYRVVEQALTEQNFRKLFSASYTALHYDFANKYLSESYKIQRHVYYELTKVQRIPMEKDQVKSYIEVVILLKNIVQLNLKSLGLQADSQGGGIDPKFIENIQQGISTQLDQLPPPILKNIVLSNISSTEDIQTDVIASIASVLHARGKSFTSNQGIDRGAETPDKSWLSTARRNYKFYGFDIRILDEFYVIAAENGW